MNFLPYERVVFRTNDAAPVVKERLAALVAAGRFRWRRPQKPFVGTLEGHRFKVVRVLGTFLGVPVHNSFRPVVLGEVVPVPEGTEVRIRFRLPLFVALFMAIWFGALLLGAATLVGHTLRAGTGPHAQNGVRKPGAVDVALFAMMALLAYALTSVPFWAEVRKAKTLLLEGLGCTECT